MTKNVPNPPTDVHVGLIGYRGVQMSAALGMVDVLEVANRYGADCDDRQINHSILQVDDLPTAPFFDAIVLPPNLTGNRGASDDKLHSWIKERHAGGLSLVRPARGHSGWDLRGCLTVGRLRPIGPWKKSSALRSSTRTSFPNIS